MAIRTVQQFSKNTPIYERLIARRIINNNTGCWEWKGKPDPTTGYIRLSFKLGGKQVWKYAHRLSYEIFVGAIPENLQIDHTCRNRACFNPAHLEAVSSIINTKRGNAGLHFALAQLAKTHCPHGHEYKGDNLFVRKNGKRECRTCQRERARNRKVGQ